MSSTLFPYSIPLSLFLRLDIFPSNSYPFPLFLLNSLQTDLSLICLEGQFIAELMIAVKPFLRYDAIINCLPDGTLWLVTMSTILEAAIMGKFGNIGKYPVDTIG